tara:strand:- start:37628 stop:37753 length:126 start_codon:yes stop_codon:yes gene_type:complete
MVQHGFADLISPIIFAQLMNNPLANANEAFMEVIDNPWKYQ